MLKSFTEIGQPRRTVVRAELIGADKANGAGFTAHGASPVLELCRLLVAGGINPDTPLHAYRGNMLCLTVHSIAEAANLDLNSKGTGFVRCRQAVRIGPPIAPKMMAALSPNRTAEALP